MQRRRHKQHPRGFHRLVDGQACGWCRALLLVLALPSVMASGPDHHNSHSQSRLLLLFPGITNDIPHESRVDDSGLSLWKDRLLLREEVDVDDDGGKRLGHEKQPERRPFRFLVDTQQGQRKRRQGKEDHPSDSHHDHHQAQSQDLSSNQVNRNPSSLSLTLKPNLKKSVRDEHKSLATNSLMDSGRALAEQNDDDAEADYKDAVEDENKRSRHLRTRRVHHHHHHRVLNAMDDMHLHKGSQDTLTKRTPQQSQSPRATFHYSATSTNTNVVVKRKPSTTFAKQPPSDGYSDFVQDLRDEEILGESSSSSPYQLLNSAPTNDEDSKKAVVEEVEATEVEEDWIEAEAEDGNGRQRGLEEGLDTDTRDIKSPAHEPSKDVQHVQTSGTDRAHALGANVRDPQVMDATFPMDLLPLSSSDHNNLHNEDTTDDDKELTNSQNRDHTEQRQQFQNDPTLVEQNSASFSVGRKAKSTTTVTVHHSQQSREDMNETVVVEEVHMAIDLPSFQLLFAMPPDSMDAMDLLRVTRHHLGDQLETCPGFTRVEVFQLLRENSVAMETLTMVAFGGTAYFESTKKRLDVTDVVVQDLTWLAFLGQNNTEYIAELHDAGVEVEDATLYDLDGTMIVYQNGTMEFMGNDDDDDDEQDDADTDGMDDMMSMTVIAVAVGVPAVVCVMVCFAYLWFYVHSRLDCHCCCFPKGRDPNDDVWLNPNVGEF